MSKTKVVSAALASDVAKMIEHVGDVLKISITDQISEALCEQYKYVWLPLIRATDRERAKRGGRRGFGQETISR
jgi:hypothetical protein